MSRMPWTCQPVERHDSSTPSISPARWNTAATCRATMPRACAARSPSANHLSVESETMANTILNVPDISCEHCERTITNALTPITGVRHVNVDIPSKQVRVDFDESKVSVEQMKDVLNEEDYPVES